VIHQPSYSILNRWVESDLLRATAEGGLGVIAFCPLAQGLLTDKYLAGIPKDSRAATKTGFLRRDNITAEMVAKLARLNELAVRRGQSLAQMSLAWVLRSGAVTSALIGASRPAQIAENIAAVEKAAFSADELMEIDRIVAG
jgi:L-glyceraldehyde 3-phosphate reductase